jgi:hypothetical protein
MWWCCDLPLQPRVPALAKTTKSHHRLVILLVADSGDFSSSRTTWSSNFAARSVNWSATACRPVARASDASSTSCAVAKRMVRGSQRRFLPQPNPDLSKLLQTADDTRRDLVSAS